MALQGNLRDFPMGEILQLLGSQKKTGCLVIHGPGAEGAIYVNDGRIVSTREPGLARGDALLAFLRTIHRLSDEQIQGLVTIHGESKRDLEDLLVNGRYLEADELSGYLERQVLNDLMRYADWREGTYQFDPQRRWPFAPLVKMSIEGALIELARRADEDKRYSQVLQDPRTLLGVRDLPDPSDPITEEERELFGVIDGRHTLSEVIDAAPMTPFEARESLFRMIESGWIETVGRRDAGAPPPPVAAPPARSRSIGRELAVALAVAVAVVVLRFGAHTLGPRAARSSPDDAYAATQVRDLRLALDLYRHERGAYPTNLDQLTEARWIEPSLLKVPGYVLQYHLVRGGADYALELTPDR